MFEYSQHYGDHSYLYGIHFSDITAKNDEARDLLIAIRLSVTNGEEAAIRAFQHAEIVEKKGRAYVEKLFEQARTLARNLATSASERNEIERWHSLEENARLARLTDEAEEEDADDAPRMQ